MYSTHGVATVGSVDKMTYNSKVDSARVLLHVAEMAACLSCEVFHM